MLQLSNPPIPKTELINRQQFLKKSHDDLPQGELKKDTELTLKKIELADDNFWYYNCNSLSGLNKYQAKYPDGKHITEIASKRDQLERQKVKGQENVDNTLKSFFKYGGLIVCVGLFFLIIYMAITTNQKITWATLAPLAYITYRLCEW